MENINRYTQKKIKIAVVANPSHLEGTYIQYLNRIKDKED